MSENDQNTGNLSPHQTKVLDCLATGATKDQAATIAGVTVRTVNRWIAEDETFKAALDELTQTAVNEAAFNLAAMLTKANKAIQGILDNAKSKDGDKLRAASLVYDIYIKIKEFQDLDGRIKALEEAQNGGA
jgi:hypothetical protein